MSMIRRSKWIRVWLNRYSQIQIILMINFLPKTCKEWRKIHWYSAKKKRISLIKTNQPTWPVLQQLRKINQVLWQIKLISLKKRNKRMKVKSNKNRKSINLPYRIKIILKLLLSLRGWTKYSQKPDKTMSSARDQKAITLKKVNQASPNIKDLSIISSS